MSHQGRCGRGARAALLAALVATVLSPSAHAFGKKRPGSDDPGGTPAAPEHGSMVLRVLSYNIQGRPFDPPQDYPKIGEALRARREAGTAPHIVGIQEAFDKRTDVVNRLAGYPHVAKGPGTKPLKLNSGLVVLSEFPITRTATDVYSDCLLWDCFARKGIVHARIAVPGLPRPIDFYDTHVQASYSSHSYEQFDFVRLWQFQEAREHIWDTRDSRNPQLFIGDFNSHPEDHAFQSLVAFLRLTDAAARCSETGLCEGDAEPGEDYRNSVDHQFTVDGVSPGIRFEPVYFEKVFDGAHGDQLSDHEGLEVHYLLTW